MIFLLAQSFPEPWNACRKVSARSEISCFPDWRTLGICRKSVYSSKVTKRKYSPWKTFGQVSMVEINHQELDLPSIAIIGCGDFSYIFTSTERPAFLSFSPYIIPSSLSMSSSQTPIHALGTKLNDSSGANIGELFHSLRSSTFGKYKSLNQSIRSWVSAGV